MFCCVCLVQGRRNRGRHLFPSCVIFCFFFHILFVCFVFVCSVVVLLLLVCFWGLFLIVLLFSKPLIPTDPPMLPPHTHTHIHTHTHTRPDLHMGCSPWAPWLEGPPFLYRHGGGGGGWWAPKLYYPRGLLRPISGLAPTQIHKHTHTQTHTHTHTHTTTLKVVLCAPVVIPSSPSSTHST